MKIFAQSPPYTMEKLDAQDSQRVGNDRYEGFVVDLINAIADIVGFNVRSHGRAREKGRVFL